MDFSSQCKNRTYLCGTASYPISCNFSIGPRTEICGNPGLPFAMVPFLHQMNVYIKTKLQVWRVQKCILLVGAKTALTCAGRHTTPPDVSQYRA